MSRPDGRQGMYDHQPMFRSQIAGAGVVCEGIGEVSSDLDTVGFFVARPTTTDHTQGRQNNEKTYARGIVYYLRNSKVVGVLLWNASEQLERARALLRGSSARAVANPREDLRRRILLAPDHWIDTEVE